MKKIKKINKNDNQKSDNRYKQYTAKNAKLTQYDKALINYIIDKLIIN